MVGSKRRDNFGANEKINRMKTKFFTLLLPVVLLAACRKDSSPAGEVPAKDYARLKVSVKICTDAACDSLLQVPGAKVYLYEDKVYRDEGFNLAFDGTTDAAGETVFAALEKNEYWLTIVMPKPDGRSLKEYSRTPQRTTTFLEVLF